MKTAPRISEKANFGRAILLVALVILLGSTGCQKDDQLMPSTNKTISENGAFTDQDLSLMDETSANVLRENPANTFVFNLIKINHVAAKSNLPDYSVTVRNDGVIIYEGRRNVKVQGRVAFRVSNMTLPVLHEIFEQYGFYSIYPDFEVYPDMPLVYTSYRPNIDVKIRTIYDNYSDNPQRLILIRKSVENLLGIEKYVNFTGPNVSLQLPAPVF